MAEKTVNKQRDKQVRGRPFEPGKSGNMNGRPKKGHSITEAMKEMLGQRPEVKAAIVEKIGDAAMAGDIAAAKLLWSYMDGMPKQAIENSGEVVVRKVTGNAGDSSQE